jgi:hypothetical protein
MSLFVSCYKTFVTTLWPPMPQPQQTPYPLQILTLLPSFFTPADLKSKPQTTRNYQTELGGGGNINIPLNPQNHRYLLLSQHNINIFSLSTSCSSSPCFLSAIKIAHQINQETPQKNKKTTKTKVRYKEEKKEKRVQNSSYLVSAAPNFPQKIGTRGHELVMMQSLPHLDCKRTRLLRHKRKHRIQSR